MSVYTLYEGFELRYCPYIGWGHNSGKVHSIQETMIRYKVSQKYYLEQEDYLLRQVGLVLENNYNSDTLLQYKVDTAMFKEMIQMNIELLDSHK